jgi:hypothetical protein
VLRFPTHMDTSDGDTNPVQFLQQTIKH